MNRDPVTAQMQQMRNQIEQLQAELLYVKGDSSTPFEELQVRHLLNFQSISLMNMYTKLKNLPFFPQLLKQKIAILETSNADLQKQLQEHQVNFEHLTKQATDAQVS